MTAALRTGYERGLITWCTQSSTTHPETPAPRQHSELAEVLSIEEFEAIWHSIRDALTSVKAGLASGVYQEAAPAAVDATRLLFLPLPASPSLSLPLHQVAPLSRSLARCFRLSPSIDCLPLARASPHVPHAWQRRES